MNRLSSVTLPIPLRRISPSVNSKLDSLMFSSGRKIHAPNTQSTIKADLIGSDAEQPTKLVIVEDEAIVALDISMTLKKLGYQVIGIMTSGLEVMQCIPSLKPDIVLMDIRLRGDIDGIQLAEYIGSELGVPVIFVTGQADTVTLERAQAIKPAAYLLKPFSQLDLQDSIQRALEHNRHK